MTQQLEKICLQLDDLALQYLSKLEEYGQEWKVCSSDFQQGFLDLAQAKYSMGFTNVSQSSYDERMKAQLRIQVENSTFSISTPEEPTDESNLRRRTSTRFKKDEWIEVEREQELPEEYEMNEKKKPGKPKRSNNDPLRWFGYLVPPCLQTSQTHFKTATMRMIEQANRMNELKLLEEEYEMLKKKKNKLLLDQSIP
ncbi:hypothetical protein CLU79DRAFT_759674 [Phycomyces nitens]|nr:hypothetical protein CLU79DRAFT_759674 [Phycomyces nitens]